MSTPAPTTATITGLVLAGGQARRMGGVDKGLVEIRGRPMVVWVAEALGPQVATVLINANRNAERHRALTGADVIADDIDGFAGPLAGMAAGMAAARTPWLLTAPCDSPLVAPTLAATLAAAVAASGAPGAVAHDGERLQPVFALLACHLLADLRATLAAGERKIDRWYAHRGVVPADLSAYPEMFLNVNTPEDRADLEARLVDDSTT